MKKVYCKDCKNYGISPPDYLVDCRKPLSIPMMDTPYGPRYAVEVWEKLFEVQNAKNNCPYYEPFFKEEGVAATTEETKPEPRKTS